MIRHALPDFGGGERIFMGQRCDLPLSEEGKNQARQLAEDFPALPLETIYCSPLKRCRETARPLSERFHLPLRVMEDLAELDGGQWDGMKISTIRERCPEFFTGTESVTPPGGESDEEGLVRIRRALSFILEHTNHYAVIVSHGAWGRLLLSQMPGLNSRHGILQDYAFVSHLIWRDGQWSVRAISVPSSKLWIQTDSGKPVDS